LSNLESKGGYRSHRAMVRWTCIRRTSRRISRGHFTQPRESRLRGIRMSTTLPHGERSTSAMPLTAGKYSNAPEFASLPIRNAPSRAQRLTLRQASLFRRTKARLKTRPSLVTTAHALHLGLLSGDVSLDEASTHVQGCSLCLSWASTQLPNPREMINIHHWGTKRMK